MNTFKNSGSNFFNQQCVGDISPFFFWSFGRNAPSPETIDLDVPPHPLPQDLYAKHLVLE